MSTGVEPSGSDQHVQVYVSGKRLAPGMQRREQSGLRAEVLWICQQLLQCPGGRGEQRRGETPAIESPNRVQLVWYGKDNVVMRTVQ
jgi:hypothetical protein